MNLYFEKWNSESALCIDDLQLPFYTDFNKPRFETENILYKYLCNLKQPMLIINSFQHDTKLDGDSVSGMIDSTKDITVEETDILVVHRDYGLLLFEVKGIKKVVTMKEENIKEKQ